MFVFIVVVLTLTSVGKTCEILKASDCPPGPTKDDEDLMKSELYTKEQLFAFCDAGKTYADCMNERLHCCDTRMEYASALASLDAQLKRNAWRTGRFCSGISETNTIHYRCSTTLATSLSTISTHVTTSMRICDVEQVGQAKCDSYTIR
jgi:hypothetical protein